MTAASYCRFVNCLLKTARGPFFCLLPVRHGHWFTKYYSYKWVTRPISKEILEKYKERSGVKLPNGKLAPQLLRKCLDNTVPESVSKIHSYDFAEMEAAIKDVMNEKIIELGLNPVEDSTAHQIVRLTIRLRVQREQMEKQKNSASIERSLLEMLDHRQGLLRLLRSEDYAMFLSLARALDLTYEHDPRPQEAEAPKPGFPLRQAEMRARCLRLKERRLAELAEKTEAAKGDFLRRREAALAESRQKLASLGLTLDQVLDEVYADRRAAAEKELLEDKLAWFYSEQREHLKYAAKLAEKAKAAQAKARK